MSQLMVLLKIVDICLSKILFSLKNGKLTKKLFLKRRLKKSIVILLHDFLKIVGRIKVMRSVFMEVQHVVNTNFARNCFSGALL